MPRTVRMICASRSMSRRAALRYKTLQSQELRYAHTLSCLLQLTLTAQGDLNTVRRTVRMICASRSMSRRVALRQMPIAEPSAPSRARSVPPRAAAACASVRGAGTAACACST